VTQAVCVRIAAFLVQLSEARSRPVSGCRWGPARDVPRLRLRRAAADIAKAVHRRVAAGLRVVIALVPLTDAFPAERPGDFEMFLVLDALGIFGPAMERPQVSVHQPKVRTNQPLTDAKLPERRAALVRSAEPVVGQESRLLE
jgi:hypothetical protein